MVEENLDSDNDQVLPTEEKPDYLKRENLPNYLAEDEVVKPEFISEPPKMTFQHSDSPKLVKKSAPKIE